MEENEQARLLVLAIEHAGITPGQLWLRYFGLGGSAGEYEVEAYLHELHSLPALQRDLLAHAANELIDELPPRPRAPYSDQPASGRSTAGGDADTGQRDEEAESN